METASTLAITTATTRGSHVPALVVSLTATYMGTPITVTEITITITASAIITIATTTGIRTPVATIQTARTATL